MGSGAVSSEFDEVGRNLLLNGTHFISRRVELSSQLPRVFSWWNLSTQPHPTTKRSLKATRPCS